MGWITTATVRRTRTFLPSHPRVALVRVPPRAIVCADGRTTNSCRPGLAGNEVCDGEDNDCDGAVDEAPQCGCEPIEERCDGIDNDCMARRTRPCSASVDLRHRWMRSQGEVICFEGAAVDTCDQAGAADVSMGSIMTVIRIRRMVLVTRRLVAPVTEATVTCVKGHSSVSRWSPRVLRSERR